MITASAPVEEVIVELEQLIKGLRDGEIKCAVLHKTCSIERVNVTLGEIAYVKTESVDLSFSKRLS